MQKSKVLQVEQTDLITILSEIDVLIENRLKSFNPKPSSPTDAEELFTVEETAKFLKVSNPTIHDWANKKVLTRHKIGNKTRFLRSEIMNTLKAINAREGIKP
jgi:excisionase family DNA binding protein